MSKIDDLMKSFRKSAIDLTIEFDNENTPCGASKFGGRPDVPDGFEWPYFKGSCFSEEAENRPLSFIAQINCKDIAELDEENLLPKKGVLSFFYEVDTQKWGFDPKDKGCARVYYFEDTDSLSPMEFPGELGEEFRYAPAVISPQALDDYPCSQLIDGFSDDEYDEYDEAYDSYLEEHDDFRCKLLGYPDLLQGDVFTECELVSRGIYTGDANYTVTEEITKAAEDWMLLFQMDTVENEKTVMMFGDCGRIYYCIRKQDLKSRSFENAWLILQCF